MLAIMAAFYLTVMENKLVKKPNKLYYTEEGVSSDLHTSEWQSQRFLFDLGD